jgi:lysophospholipase L1-like esterase
MKTPATTAAAAKAFRIRPSIVLYGDSITQFGFGKVDSDNIGWSALLSSAYTRRCDVFNRGFSGYNTRDALALIPRVFGTFPASVPPNPHVVENNNPQEGKLLFCTVFFGANDAASPGEDQHIPIDQYGDNLDKIIESIGTTVSGGGDATAASSAHDFPIILMTPPPIDEKAWADWRRIESLDRTNAVARQYGLKLKEVAANHDNCAVLDTWELLQGNSSRKERGQHLCDGLHLNQSGNRLVFQGLMDQVIKVRYPHLAPMDDDDGDGKYGKIGLPVEEKLWTEFYN